MNEKQKQALEVLNKLMYESYYEKMTKEEYFLLLEFVFPCQQVVYPPYTFTDWTTTSKPPFNPSCTTDGNSVNINDTPKEEE